MNQPAATSSRPHLLCRVVRLWRSPSSGIGARHVASCADCQKFLLQSDTIESALRRDAAKTAIIPPVGLDRGILQAVRNSQADAAGDFGGRRLGVGLAIGGALAAVALSVVLFRQQPITTPVAVTPAAESAAMASAIDELSDRWWNSVLPEATMRVQDNALQHELDAVYGDARMALGFLALNFLPASANQPAKPARSG